MQDDILKREMNKEIEGVSKDWNLSKKDAKELLEGITQPSLRNIDCDFSDRKGIGVQIHNSLGKKSE